MKMSISLLEYWNNCEYYLYANHHYTVPLWSEKPVYKHWMPNIFAVLKANFLCSTMATVLTKYRKMGRVWKKSGIFVWWQKSLSFLCLVWKYYPMVKKSVKQILIVFEIMLLDSPAVGKMGKNKLFFLPDVIVWFCLEMSQTALNFSFSEVLKLTGEFHTPFHSREQYTAIIGHLL